MKGRTRREMVRFFGKKSKIPFIVFHVIISDATQEIEYASNMDSYHLYACELCDDICYRSRAYLMRDY